MNIANVVQEKRIAPRKRVLSAVKIYTGFGLDIHLDPRAMHSLSVFDALILDRSATGIKIDMSGSGHHLPERFVIGFPDGTRKFGRVAWSSGTTSGIEFLAPDKEPEFSP